MGEDEFTIVLRYYPNERRQERWSASSPTSNTASTSVYAATPQAALRRLTSQAGLNSIETRFRDEAIKAAKGKK